MGKHIILNGIQILSTPPGASADFVINAVEEVLQNLEFQFADIAETIELGVVVTFFEVFPPIFRFYLSGLCDLELKLRAVAAIEKTIREINARRCCTMELILQPIHPPLESLVE